MLAEPGRVLAEPGRVLADPGREGDAEEVDVAEDGRALVAEPGRSAASAGWLSPIRCIHAGVGAGCFFFTGAELGRSLRGSARRTGAEAGRLAGRPPLALVLTLGRIGGRLEDIAATLSLFSLTVIAHHDPRAFMANASKFAGADQSCTVD